MIHGTTQSQTGWALLERELERRGHTCHSVDLVALPDDLSAAGYADAIAAVVDAPHPVVVAHSGSGLLLGAIARATTARHQVFLAAAIPSGDQSLMDELRQRSEEMFNPEWIGKDPIGNDEIARRFLFHDCDEATTMWAMQTLRLFLPTNVYDEVVPLDVITPATVIVPSEDRTVRPTWMKRAAAERLGISATVIDGGHCPHVSRPDEVAAIIDHVAVG